jgi:hypothetical protein
MSIIIIIIAIRSLLIIKAGVQVQERQELIIS